jgi:hypothetical protein
MHTRERTSFPLFVHVLRVLAVPHCQLVQRPSTRKGHYHVSYRHASTVTLCTLPARPKCQCSRGRQCVQVHCCPCCCYSLVLVHVGHLILRALSASAHVAGSVCAGALLPLLLSCVCRSCCVPHKHCACPLLHAPFMHGLLSALKWQVFTFPGQISV